MTALISKFITSDYEIADEFYASYRVRLHALREEQISNEYADVLGVRVSAINMERAVELADQWISAGRPGYTCVCAVHSIMEAQKEERYLEILNRAAFNLPDGMPLTWIGRLQGQLGMDRVCGPDFMLEMCRLSVERGYRHFLYGGRPGVVEQLGANLRRRFSGIKIVGTYTPPFRNLNAEEERELVNQVHESRPDILWVGIGAPKQERFMAHYVQQLQVPLMVGVGAAFDYHTGRIRDSPNWVKRAGLQWLHRLIQEPRRLWWRYMSSNPAFLWNVAWQLSGLRDYSTNLRKTSRSVEG
jgi:N-acetylglucosaminyldiphosphoundecaprenol N-acetyl-beta-D-mannosaminyltransferase